MAPYVGLNLSGSIELLDELGGVGGHCSGAATAVYLSYYSMAQGEVVHCGMFHPLPNSVWDEQDSV